MEEIQSKSHRIHGGLSHKYFESSTSHTLGGSSGPSGSRGGELGAIKCAVWALSRDERSWWKILGRNWWPNRWSK